MKNLNIRSQLTPKLRYEWISPSELKFTDAEPTWTQPADQISESILSLLDEQWHTDHLKAELLRLNFKPQERGKYALSAQLVSEFINPERIASCLSALSKTAYKFYLYQLLAQTLANKFTTPANLETVFQLPLSLNLANKQILDAGLALRTESGALYIPEAIFKALPPSHIDFPVASDPDKYIPAKASLDFIFQVQNIIGLFDGQEFQHRNLLRWNSSDYAYYSHLHCWPPHPDDAKYLVSGFQKIREISLLPPEPQLDETTLQFWAKDLEISPDHAEFHYQLLIQGAILHAGSPVRINASLVRKWLALPPGRQIVILYELYRSLTTWTAWWSAWREGRIDIKWNYQGYWGLTHIDATLLSTNVNMRGVLLDMLSFLPQEQWLSFDDVIDWILTVFPNSVSHQYSRGLIFTSVADGWRNWLQLVLQSILTGPLHNLGLVDVAPSLNYVEVFRLHHFQDVHWRRVTHLDIEIGETMGDRTIHLEAESKTLKVTMPIHPDFLFVIQQWSKIGSIKGKTLVFHLDVDSLHQTFEQGITLIDICDAWEKHTGVKPPDYLLTWWNRWWHNYGQVRLYSPEAILMTRDSFTMKEVQLAVPRLSVSLQEMITPTTAVIKSENVDQVVEDLERQGYMPKKVG